MKEFWKFLATAWAFVYILIGTNLFVWAVFEEEEPSYVVSVVMCSLLYAIGIQILRCYVFSKKETE